MGGSRLSIVGAGIVGLMTAFEAMKRWPEHQLIVLDEGPDPRLLHGSGATYSGLDARHISLTETGPWTSSSRSTLIRHATRDGGWNCLDAAVLTRDEAAWLEEFVAIADHPQLHEDNCSRVTHANRLALRAWRELSATDPDIFAPTDPSMRLPIVCATKGDLLSEWSAERALDDGVAPARRDIPRSLRALDQALARGTIYGSFSVEGSAFSVKTMCETIITRLESANVEFRWGTRVDLGVNGALNLPPGAFVWATGASCGASRFLAKQGVRLQGVAGCWVAIPNDGFSQAFKLLAPEPVNFINATPAGSTLLLSGGYGWVGQRSHAEAVTYVESLQRVFLDTISCFFVEGRREALNSCPTAICIRPALPSGVPTTLLVRCGEHRGAICVGHAAGGFTQAPVVARTILDELSHALG